MMDLPVLTYFHAHFIRTGEPMNAFASYNRHKKTLPWEGRENTAILRGMANTGGRLRGL